MVFSYSNKDEAMRTMSCGPIFQLQMDSTTKLSVIFAVFVVPQTWRMSQLFARWAGEACIRGQDLSRGALQLPKEADISRLKRGVDWRVTSSDNR